MGLVILPENHIKQVSIFINNGKGVELVVPNDVIGFFQRNVRIANHHFRDWRHEVLDKVRHMHAADTVVTARHNAFKMTMARTIACNSDGRVTRFFL